MSAGLFQPQAAAATGDDFLQAAKAIAIARFEQNYIRAILAANEGNVAQAAEAAGTDRRGFQRLMRKHKIRGEGSNPETPTE